MNWIEAVGIIATIFILISMCFKTVSFRGSVLMRCLNIFGCIVFVVYGALLPAISTAVLNGALVIVNTVHLVILIRDQKKKEAQEKLSEVENGQAKEKQKEENTERNV